MHPTPPPLLSHTHLTSKRVRSLISNRNCLRWSHGLKWSVSIQTICPCCKNDGLDHHPDTTERVTLSWWLTHPIEHTKLPGSHMTKGCEQELRSRLQKSWREEIGGQTVWRWLLCKHCLTLVSNPNISILCLNLPYQGSSQASTPQFGKSYFKPDKRF